MFRTMDRASETDRVENKEKKESDIQGRKLFFCLPAKVTAALKIPFQLFFPANNIFEGQDKISK